MRQDKTFAEVGHADARVNKGDCLSTGQSNTSGARSQDLARTSIMIENTAEGSQMSCATVYPCRTPLTEDRHCDPGIDVKICRARQPHACKLVSALVQLHPLQ
jgi:hypothetical protein